MKYKIGQNFETKLCDSFIHSFDRTNFFIHSFIHVTEPNYFIRSFIHVTEKVAGKKLSCHQNIVVCKASILSIPD